MDEETGTSRVYDAVIYPEYASINAIADEGAMRYVYRDGAFQLFNSPVTPAQGKPIDLADIEPELIAGLPDKTAKLQGMPDYDSAYLIVNTLSGQPGIMATGTAGCCTLQIQPQRPVIRVSRPIVTTTAVSGSPRSNRRIRKRSMSAPSTKEKTIDSEDRER